MDNLWAGRDALNPRKINNIKVKALDVPWFRNLDVIGQTEMSALNFGQK
jgi:hypothetical protein